MEPPKAISFPLSTQHKPMSLSSNAWILMKESSRLYSTAPTSCGQESETAQNWENLKKTRSYALGLERESLLLLEQWVVRSNSFKKSLISTASQSIYYTIRLINFGIWGQKLTLKWLLQLKNHSQKKNKRFKSSQRRNKKPTKKTKRTRRKEKKRNRINRINRRNRRKQKKRNKKRKRKSPRRKKLPRRKNPNPKKKMRTQMMVLMILWIWFILAKKVSLLKK